MLHGGARKRAQREGVRRDTGRDGGVVIKPTEVAAAEGELRGRLDRRAAAGGSAIAVGGAAWLGARLA
jgi:hypothetical protein